MTDRWFTALPQTVSRDHWHKLAMSTANTFEAQLVTADNALRRINRKGDKWVSS